MFKLWTDLNKNLKKKKIIIPYFQSGIYFFSYYISLKAEVCVASCGKFVDYFQCYLLLANGG